MSMLNAGGNFLYTMNISVDEGMIGFHGSLYFRQYKPAKPIKYGIKIWMTADSSNGFVRNLDVYLGKEPNQWPRICGQGYDVVTCVVRPLTNKNHHVSLTTFLAQLNY